MSAALLLVTRRAEFASRITTVIPDLAVTIAEPDTVTADQWVSAPVVVVDPVALPELRTRALPAAPQVWVVTETPPAPAVFVDAVTVRVQRLVELPLAGAWLATALRSAASAA